MTKKSVKTEEDLKMIREREVVGLRWMEIMIVLKKCDILIFDDFSLTFFLFLKLLV